MRLVLIMEQVRGTLKEVLADIVSKGCALVFNTPATPDGGNIPGSCHDVADSGCPWQKCRPWACCILWISAFSGLQIQSQGSTVFRLPLGELLRPRP